MRRFSLPQAECLAGGAAGVLNRFTPYSMINELDFAVGSIRPAHAFAEIEDGVIDLQLHSRVVVSRGRAIERREALQKLVRSSLRTARIVFLTLAHIECWYDLEHDLRVNGCPTPSLFEKYPERFCFERMKPEDVFESLRALISRVRSIGHPDQRIILAISPIPFNRTFTEDDALVANCYSKSVLRVASELVLNEFDNVDYFPCYEAISLSEPRVAWEEDGLHISRGILDVVLSNMLDVYTSKSDGLLSAA